MVEEIIYWLCNLPVVWNKFLKWKTCLECFFCLKEGEEEEEEEVEEEEEEEEDGGGRRSRKEE